MIAPKNVQYLKTPSGEELVVISRADYDAMIAEMANAAEDDADAAIYAARKAELRAEDILPPEVSSLLLKGDSRLRAIRKWRDVTQMLLMHRTDLTQGHISDLETGRRRITREVAQQLARALDVPVSWLAD
jgi:acyl-CoA reductase-like NAD-dependent aldehyde dehydrogenase